MKNFTLTAINRLHKTIYCLFITFIMSLSGFSQNVGINSTGAAPNASAGLDVDFPNMGLLIPRVALTGTANFAPMAAHVAGMIVYNSATAGDVTPGFYYSNGTKWISGFPAGSAIGNMLYWNGTAWVVIPVGTAGQYLQMSGGNTPAWSGAAFATLTTNAATAITGTSATSGAVITSDGGSTILSRGICYATTTNPTTANTIVVASPAAGTAPYSCNLTGLTPGTIYFVRAYTINNSVVSYGNQITFTTLAVIPTLAATTTASAITANSATSGGSVTNVGGATITERGICYGTFSAPTTLNSKVVDPAPGIGVFVSNMTGLSAGTTYYVRSYAINSAGTGYGTQVSFVTRPVISSTTAATAITATSAATGGTIAPFGTANLISNYGVAYSTTPNATSPTYAQTGTYPPIAGLTYTTSLSGLAASTLYYIRAYATGTGFTVYGPELSFTTTAPTVPVVTSTTAISGITDRTAKSGGAITSDGGSPITAKGVCWSTSPNPILGASNFTSNGTGPTAFTSNITGLTGSTTYYVRAYATNAIGTAYGPVDVTFTTWVTAPYTLGQNVGYGIVGYVAPDGSGFVVSPDIYPTAPATNFTWGCNGTHVAVGTALGTGKANTDLIITSCGVNNAAGIAKAYNGGAFTDWYLPSTGEWAVISPVYYLFGLRGNTSYLTSSEYGTNYTYASSYFHNGSQAYASGSPRLGDAYTMALRAIRNFAAASVPTVATTVAAYAITGTSATSGGNITSDGGNAVTARGVCWSTITGPTIALATKTADGIGTGTFVSNITGLTSGITYYVRAYATNSVGTSYGPEISFVAVLTPTVTTDPLGSLVGSIAEGNYTVVNENGTVTSAGLCWSTAADPSLITPNTVILPDPWWATGSSGFSWYLDMTGLTVGTLYHVRAYATNADGTAYGADVSFTATAATLGQSIFLNQSSGVVFSVNANGSNGLIALDFSPGSLADWGCTNSLVGTTSTNIGTGNANSNAILADITTNLCTSAAPGAFAPQLCQTFDLPNWYLPSKDELNLLWTTVTTDQVLYSGLTFGLTLAPYWSSSEVDATNAWYFDGITWLNTGLKTAQYNVWPIRSF